MKKTYLSPETLDVKLLSEPLMNVVSGETGSAGTGEGEAGDDDSEEAAGKHRGTWGNVW